MAESYEVADPVAIYGPLLAPAVVTTYSVIESCVDNGDREALVRIMVEFEHMRQELQIRAGISLSQQAEVTLQDLELGPKPVWQHPCGCVTPRWTATCSTDHRPKDDL